MLAERVIDWTRDWKQQGIEEGRKEGLQQGLQQGLVHALLVFAERRFGVLPAAVREALEREQDLTRLNELLHQVTLAPDLETFVQFLTLGGNGQSAGE